MDLPSKNMYDTFKDDIWRDLGPLDPDWFDVLTAQRFTNEGNVSDQEDLCANQEGNFKVPLDKTAVDSQLFSTPRVFRHHQPVSPETEDEQLLSNEHEKETLPWMATQSPHLFQMSREGVHPKSPDSFDLLHTPQKSPVSYTKHISESLGAQIHPDISWTSSLNTPPAVPSTLILSKPDESPCPVSVSEDKNVVFVRKLFPSLSNASRVGAVSPKDNDVPTIHQGGVSSETGQNPESCDNPLSSLNQSESVWRQKLPNAIEDGEIHSTVASALDGAENVLSIFFTNSSSALRKVKTDNKGSKRKRLVQPNNCTAVKTDDQEPVKCSSTQPVQNGDIGITQWSPLSLSEIPACSVNTSYHDKCPAQVKIEQLQSDSEFGQPVRLPLTITDSGFTNKKRKFVYTVETSKTQVQEKEIQPQKRSFSRHKVSIKQLGKSQNEAGVGRNEIEKQENITDLDMSQLCRDFAQDFSQMSNQGNLSEVTEDTPQNDFSSSACLLAIKRTKQEARQANLHQDCDGISNRGHVSATNQNYSINEGTVSDSGFQSAVADITNLTTILCGPPSLENSGQSQQWSGIKTDIHGTASFLSSDKGNGKIDLHNSQETGTMASQTMSHDRVSELHMESTSTNLPNSGKGSAHGINFIPLSYQMNGGFPEKTTVSSVSASGFKTASNKDIAISSVNLERAKHLFEDSEAEKTFSDQPTQSIHDTKDEFTMNYGSVKNIVSNSNRPFSSTEKFGDVTCQLTASQKADVTELCTLLEEADSQFEFTQFKTTPLKHCQDNATSFQKDGKDLDPDFLKGINFDDSFSSDAEKQQTTTVNPEKITSVSGGETNCETSKVSSKVTATFSGSVKKENSSTEDVSSSSKHDSESASSIMLAEPKSLDTAGCADITKQNKNPLMLGVGFKTAGGNVLKVSKQCLSKARALFADLEEDVTDHKSPDNQNTKSNAITEQGQVTGISDKGFNAKINMATCQSGFRMASGKGISVSAKAMQEADSFFKDCSPVDSNFCMSVNHKKSIKPLAETVANKLNPLKCKVVHFSEEPAAEFKNINAEPAACHSGVAQHNVEIQSFEFNNTQASVNAVPFHENPSSSVKAPSLLYTTSNNTDSSATNELSKRGGFCTASGKKVFVSADAMKKAECLLHEIYGLEDTNKEQKQKADALTTDKHSSQIPFVPPKSCGFQTASGKGVVISSAALRKAQSLLNECEASQDKMVVKSACSKMPVSGPSSRNSGFFSGSGKPVAFSAEALQKAKVLFSDISFSAEIPAGSDTRTSDKKQDSTGKMDKINCGFMTAGGTAVHVSQKNLLKAKNLLNEFNGLDSKAMQDTDAFFKECDSNNGFSVSETSVAPVGESDSKRRNLSKFEAYRGMTNISGDSGSACCEFDNEKARPTVNHENMQQNDNVDIFKGVFKSTPESVNPVSLPGNSSLTAKSSQLSTTLKNVAPSTFSESGSAGGFCTASGKKVSVSDDALTKAKSLLNESGVFEVTDILKQNKDTLPSHSDGFQTASGKGIAISFAALTKAKTLLSEYEDVHKISVPCPPPRNSGCHSTSDKSDVFSSEAHQMAKSLFSDICINAEVPGVSDSKTSSKHKHAQNNVEEIMCGFRTAGGAKVHVSQKNLFKAKNLLKELAGEDCCDLSAYSASSHDAHKSDLVKMIDLKRTSDTNLGTANDEDMPATECAPQTVKSVLSLNETDHENDTPQNPGAHGCIPTQDKSLTDAFKWKQDKTALSWVNKCDNPGEEMPSVLYNEVNHNLSSEGPDINKTAGSSVPVCQSLNLSECTDTQQKFLAQEALDCTKALLEDEGLAGHSLLMTLGNVPMQDNPNEQKRRWKRPTEDADMNGQPPLKRQLLEEFNRTVDGPRSSTLHPEKSCPNGIMNDRSVFKYSVSLHPNITRPQRNGKGYVDTGLQKTLPTQQSMSGDSRSTHSKMSVFVSPFQKNIQMKTCKSTVLNDKGTRSAFIPPFKKQRIIVQDSCSKAQEDKHNHHFVAPSNSSTYVPPTKETQSSTDVTGSKGKEDTETVAFTDTTNDNLINNQNVSVGYGSEDSAAEASWVGNTLSTNQDMFQNLENVDLARDMQDMRIRKKRRQTIRPLPGSLFLTKTSGVLRISLRAAVNGKLPARYTQKQMYTYGVQQHVSDITSETAETFRFNLQQFLNPKAFVENGGVQLADGGWLICSSDWTAGKEEFYRALCDTPGVDPKLISEEWVYNHYRWIVWKQASMERAFPETMGSLCLTPEQVLLQLKYRYDVEVDHSHRSALKKIMEKDDTAAKTLVLCVCGVVSRGHSPNRQRRDDTKTLQGSDGKVENLFAVVWLTDGWYAIKTLLDEPLTAMLHKGRLAVGGKLIIHGAQLVGSNDACSPLEAPDSLMLKICANSSRPARWDSKLGFHRDPRPFLLPISSLYSNGGPVGCVDIVILRSYPIQWMERKPDGGIVFRSIRAEEKEARRYNSHKQKAIEILFAKIQAEFEEEEKGNYKPHRRRQTISDQDIANLQDGEELYEAVGDDPAYLEAHLSEQQLATLHTYRCALMEKKQAELQDRYRRALEAQNDKGSCPKRDVTPVWRLCIADSMDQHGSVYRLNLWRPSSDLQALLKEGCRYKVYNLTTSDGKKCSGIETVQLTGTKKTQFQDLLASEEWLSARFQPRVATNFVDLQNPDFQSLCGEVDLTGYVISIIDGQGSSPAFFLANGRLNFVKVRCFNSLSQSGLEDVVKPRVLLALSNLQLRGQATSPTPVVFAGDLTVFSTNPKEVHLQESLSQLRNLIQGQENFFLNAEEKLSHLVKPDGLSFTSSPALQPGTPVSTTCTKTNVVRTFTPVSRNPPAATSSTEKDPRSLKRRRALDYLSRVPSPPALTHLASVTSPCVKKTFNPPRRSATPSSLKTVQPPACKAVSLPVEDEWVNDEELAMIDTQALCDGDVL
ncbi:breast cancer type 2 susceptibility protein isoform X3 [Mastacembelus armatus]|uniref:breast cancer type 2 susceptibility protein isoform X3 n=1 Tax=Mastacembelus armatus TaxID=205130 RepID=UPI000E4662B3|nr:breast cancer type 2 susceptibility protein isoform X3 [Mastacembelus armatus]